MRAVPALPDVVHVHGLTDARVVRIPAVLVQIARATMLELALYRGRAEPQRHGYDMRAVAAAPHFRYRFPVAQADASLLQSHTCCYHLATRPALQPFHGLTLAFLGNRCII